MRGRGSACVRRGISAPKGRQPPTQNRAVLRPRDPLRCAPVLEGVTGLIDGAPRRVERLVHRRRLYEPSAMMVAGTELTIVPLGFDKGHAVGSAIHRGPPELNAVILPEADRANLAGTGHLIENEMPGPCASPVRRAYRPRWRSPWSPLPGAGRAPLMALMPSILRSWCRSPYCAAVLAAWSRTRCPSSRVAVSESRMWP